MVSRAFEDFWWDFKLKQRGPFFRVAQGRPRPSDVCVCAFTGVIKPRRHECKCRAIYTGQTTCAKPDKCGAYLPVSRIVEKVALLEEDCREVGSGYLAFG